MFQIMELEVDHQQQSSQRKQVSAFRLPDQWKPNGANETAWNNNKIQRIPNGANEAVMLKLKKQWIPNGANEAVIRCKPSPQKKGFSNKESVSIFFNRRLWVIKNLIINRQSYM